MTTSKIPGFFLPISPRDSVEIPWRFREAHSTLAIALNRLGGFSNTGEGGEDPARYGLGVSKSAVQVIPICSSHEIDYINDIYMII